MTVRELVDSLNKFPDSKQVYLYDNINDTYTHVDKDSIYYQVDPKFSEPIIAINIC